MHYYQSFIIFYHCIIALAAKQQRFNGRRKKFVHIVCRINYQLVEWNIVIYCMGEANLMQSAVLCLTKDLFFSHRIVYMSQYDSDFELEIHVEFRLPMFSNVNLKNLFGPY